MKKYALLSCILVSLVGYGMFSPLASGGVPRTATPPAAQPSATLNQYELIFGTATPYVEPTWEPTSTATLAPDGSNLVEKTQAPGEVVFLDHTISVDGQCISGDCAPGPQIGFPGYSWDSTHRKLKIDQPGFSYKDNAKIIYGETKILNGLAGNGFSQQLYELFDVPAYLPGEVRLMELFPDGTIYFTVRTEAVSLDPGSTYCDQYIEVQPQGEGDIQRNVSECFTNQGFLNRYGLVLK